MILRSIIITAHREDTPEDTLVPLVHLLVRLDPRLAAGVDSPVVGRPAAGSAILLALGDSMLSLASVFLESAASRKMKDDVTSYLSRSDVIDLFLLFVTMNGQVTG